MRIELTTEEAGDVIAALYDGFHDELAWHIELQLEHHERGGDWPDDVRRYWPDRQAFIAEVYGELVTWGRDDLADVLEIEFT